MKRLLLAALAGGLALFAWSAFLHMASPLKDAGWKALPAAGEAPLDSRILALLRESSVEAGMYALPWREGETEEVMQERVRAEGSAILTYQPPYDWEAAFRRLLLQELLSNVAAAFVAACLLACTPLRGLLPRAGFVAMLGLVAWLAIEVSYWNWYSFPGTHLAAQLIEQVGGFFVVGLAISKLTPVLGARTA